MRRLVVVLVCLLGASFAAAPAAAAGRGVAALIAIDGPVDDTTVAQVRRGLAEAKRAGADAVVLDIDSNDGLAKAAEQVRDAVFASDVPVDAYVRHATSGSALVALSAAHIAMAPGAVLGDAPPFPADARAVAALRDEFERTASHRARAPLLAGAMVDPSVPAAAYHQPGTLLTLTDVQAHDGGISDGTAPTLRDALAMFGLGTTIDAASSTPFERLVRFATSPAISGVLLAIAFLGLLIELQTLHVIAGVVGALALAAFFGAHVAVGFADTMSVAIGLAGVALILAELHVFPGHGVAGVLGIGALVASVVLAFGLPFIAGALQALALAIVLSAVAFALLQRVLPENAFVRRLTFAGAQGPDYVAAADYRSLLGASGVAVSFLRPVGLASFGERRVDVLSEGDFVPAGTPVRVTRVEGARIFVRPEVEP